MRRLLVDSHAILWWLTEDPALSPEAAEVMADPGNELLVSIATLWEIAIKRSLGKLQAPDDLPKLLAGQGFDLLPITAAHAWAVSNLPRHHGDPFDRLLIAQALAEALPVITADARFPSYGLGTVW